MAIVLLTTSCQTRTPSNGNVVARLSLFGGPHNPSFSAELTERNAIVVHRYEDGSVNSHKVVLSKTLAAEIHVMWMDAFHAPAPPAEGGGRQIMDGLKVLVSIKENGTFRSGEAIHIKGIQSANPHVRHLVQSINGLIVNDRFKLY